MALTKASRFGGLSDPTIVITSITDRKKFSVSLSRFMQLKGGWFLFQALGSPCGAAGFCSRPSVPRTGALFNCAIDDHSPCFNCMGPRGPAILDRIITGKYAKRINLRVIRAHYRKHLAVHRSHDTRTEIP